jgi:hypothetical protein
MSKEELVAHMVAARDQMFTAMGIPASLMAVEFKPIPITTQ